MRGLKSIEVERNPEPERVAPFMGAWIEITMIFGLAIGLCLVAPFMGAWIEICRSNGNRVRMCVAPFMGAWIEIPGTCRISVR